MERLNEIKIRKFEPQDQVQVKNLILAGLVDHWGFLDSTKNLDLDDIQVSYQEATFLVATLHNEIVGCGALVPLSASTAQIMRMSILNTYRRQGIGTLLLDGLLMEAKRKGVRQVILETTSSWEDAVSFYLQNGFKITHVLEGNTYFSKKI